MQETEVLNKLSEQGFRLTPQRMMILSAIVNSDHHVTAEEIYNQVRAKYPHVNISTVYRTLELVKKLGFVTETDLGGGSVTYHPVDKGRHHHLVCQKCGSTIDLDDSVLFPLKELLSKKYGFTADLKHLAIFGHCRNCGAKD